MLYILPSGMNNFNLSSQWDEAIATYAYGKMGQLLLIFFSGMRKFLFIQSAGRDEGTVVATYSFGGMTLFCRGYSTDDKLFCRRDDAIIPIVEG
jgi:hypothetical protein